MKARTVTPNATRCGRRGMTLNCVLLSVALLGLSACSGSLLNTKLPLPTTYVLTAAPPTASGINVSTVDLAISQAAATPGLDTERIAVLHEARRLDYYVDAQWGAALPQVAQSMVVSSLQNQKWFRSVTSEQAHVNAAYWIELEVRDFQAEYAREDAPPNVHVTLAGSLIRIKDRKLLGVLPATVTVNATENKLSAVIAAFEAAAQQASLSLGQQAASVIQSSAAPQLGAIQDQ